MPDTVKSKGCVGDQGSVSALVVLEISDLFNSFPSE